MTPKPPGLSFGGAFLNLLDIGLRVTFPIACFVAWVLLVLVHLVSDPRDGDEHAAAAVGIAVQLAILVSGPALLLIMLTGRR